MKKQLVLLALLLGLMPAATCTVSAQNACSKQVDDKEVEIKVINKTNKPFTVNWVDHECKEGKSDPVNQGYYNLEGTVLEHTNPEGVARKATVSFEDNGNTMIWDRAEANLVAAILFFPSRPDASTDVANHSLPTINSRSLI